MRLYTLPALVILLANTLAQAQPAAISTGSFGRLPLTFEQNMGQFDSRVKFVTRGPNHAVLLTGEDTIVLLTRRSRASRPGGDQTPLEQTVDVTTTAVRLRITGAGPSTATGLRRLPGVSNYFIGRNSRTWKRNVPTYEAVQFKGIGRDVDLQFYGNDRQLEFDIIAPAGRNTAELAIEYDGVDQVAIDAAGCVCLHTSSGKIYHRKPVAYQVIRGSRRKVDCRYRHLGGKRVGFTLGRVESSAPVCIDPVLDFSTYLGGENQEQPSAGPSVGGIGTNGVRIAVDSLGNPILAGYTASALYPTTTGLQTTLKGSTDVVVSKLNSSGTALVYSTYIGGTLFNPGGTRNEDVAYGIAIDTGNNAYITGSTNSPDFPIVGAFQSALTDGYGAFATKLNPTGSIVYSTYLNGNNTDAGIGIAVDSAGSAVVVGATTSTNFPTANPYQATMTVGPANTSGFITKLSPSGATLVFSTYVKQLTLFPRAVCTDSVGNVYVPTNGSAGADTLNALQTQYGGGASDGYLMKFSPTGTLLFATFLGGSGGDSLLNIAPMPDGNIAFHGGTNSVNFPYVPAQSPPGPQHFVGKISSSGSNLVYARPVPLGSSGADGPTGIAADASNRIVVCGFTHSGDFPVVFSLKPPSGAPPLTDADAFVTCFTSDGAGIVFATLLGGSSFDFGYGIAIDPLGKILVCGTTESTNFPTVNPIQQSLSGPKDFWIAKIDPAIPPPQLSVTQLQPTVGVSGTQVNLTVASSQPLSTVTATVGGKSMSLVSQTPSSAVFRRVLDSSEGQPTPPIVITGENQAGLTSTITSTGLTTDFIPPAVVNSNFTPVAIKANATFTVTLTVDEPLQADPVVRLGSLTLTKRSLNGLTYVYDRIVPGSNPQGTLSVSASVTDTAGNSLIATLGTAVVDFVPPNITSVAAQPAVAGAGTDVTITFLSSEVLVPSPPVTVGNQTATFTSEASLLYSYSYNVSPAVTGQPTPQVLIFASDAAGNTTVGGGFPLRLDFAGPTFTAFSAVPSLARLGTTVNVSFTANEQLLATPNVTVGAEPAYPVSQNGLTYTFGVTVTSAVGNGAPVVTVRGIDIPGNVGTSTGQPLTTDFDRPTFGGITAIPAMAGVQQPVSIILTASETLQFDPAVSVGGVAAVRVAKSLLTYTYRVTTSAVMGENRPAVQIAGIDLAGNMSNQGPSTPLLTDFSTPQVIVGASPLSQNEGSQVQFSSSGTSAISGISSYLWTFGDGSTSSAANPTHAFADGPTNPTVTLNVTSGVGATGAAQLGVTVRNVSPTVTIEDLPTPAARGLVAVRWAIIDPGTLDTHRYTLMANDLGTGTNTPLAEDQPSTGLFVWDTSKSQESLFQLTLTVRDNDNGQGSKASNPAVVDNAPLTIQPNPPEPAIFNPTFGETTDLTYDISEAATSKIDLTLPGQQASLGTLQAETPVPAGANTVAWDGKDPDDGTIMSDGQYAYTVTGTDRLSRVVTENSSLQGFTVTLHTGAPNAPTVDPTPTSPTRFSSLVLIGRKDPFSAVTVSRGGAPLYIGTVDQFQTWTSSTITLNEGVNVFSLVAANRVGTLSTASSVTVALDTIAPAQVVVNAPQSPTNQPSQSLSGTKEADAKLLLDGQLLTAFTAGTTWSTTVSYLAGTTNFSFVQEDEAGNRSSPRVVAIQLNANSVATPTINAVTSPTKQATVALSGTKAADANVEITVQGIDDTAFNRVTIVPISASTAWAVAVALPEGRSTITAQSFDSIRSASGSAQRTITVDTVKPTIQISGVAEGERISGSTVPVTIQFADPAPATGILGGSLRVFYDGQDITAQATVGAGTASLTLSGIVVGSHTLAVSVSDLASNVADKSIVFNYWTDDGLSTPTLTLESASDLEFTPDNIYLSGAPRVVEVRFSVSEPSVVAVVVTSADGSVVASFASAPAIPGAEGLIRFDGKTDSGEYLAPGQYKLSLTPSNPANRPGVTSAVDCEIYY